MGCPFMNETLTRLHLKSAKRKKTLRSENLVGGFELNVVSPAECVNMPEYLFHFNMFSCSQCLVTVFMTELI